MQYRNKSISDNYHKKIWLCRDLKLDFFDTKEQFLESKELSQHLLICTHNGEDELFFNIMNYLRIVEQRNGPFQSKPFFQVQKETPMAKMEGSKQKAESASGMSQKGVGMAMSRICFNCGSRAHIAPSCRIPTRPKGACYGCGSTIHQRSACPEREQKIKDTNKEESQEQNEQKYTGSSREIRLLEPAYYVRVSIQDNYIIDAVIDSGSPISLIKSHICVTSNGQPFKIDIFTSGINGSQLNIEAVTYTTVLLVDYNKKQVFYVIDDHTMSSECILGRDFIKGMDIWFGEAGMMTINTKHEISNDNDFLCNLGLIKYEFGDDVELNVVEVPFIDKCKLIEVFNKKALKLEAPKIDYEVRIILKDHTPFNYQLRSEKGFSEGNNL